MTISWCGFVITHYRKIIFVYVLMIGLCSITNYASAQNNEQSRVTNEMALKIAHTAQNDYRRVVRDRTAAIFCDANRITSMMEYDKIMEDILHHKDKVENFIYAICSQYGIGDMGYNAFKSTYGFKVAEFEIAVEIYNNRNELLEREKAEKAEQLKLRQIAADRKTLDNWSKNGKDTLYAGQTGITAPRLLFNSGGEGIFIEPSKEKQDNNSKSHYGVSYEQYAETERSPIFVFYVGENNEVTYKNKDDWDASFDLTILSFEALAPGSMYLSGLDTTIIIPTSNDYYYITRYHKIRPVLSYRDSIHEAVIKRDKNGICKFENEYPLRMWFNAYIHNVGNFQARAQLGFTQSEEDSFIEWMANDLCEQLATEQGKKFKISFKIRGASVTTEYVNGQVINSRSFRCTAILSSNEKQ